MQIRLNSEGENFNKSNIFFLNAINTLPVYIKRVAVHNIYAYQFQYVLNNVTSLK